MIVSGIFVISLFSYLRFASVIRTVVCLRKGKQFLLH
jgi:hypothetical protein